jgi:hypothetical protein
VIKDAESFLFCDFSQSFIVRFKEGADAMFFELAEQIVITDDREMPGLLVHGGGGIAARFKHQVEFSLSDGIRAVGADAATSEDGCYGFVHFLPPFSGSVDDSAYLKYTAWNGVFSALSGQKCGKREM